MISPASDGPRCWPGRTKDLRARSTAPFSLAGPRGSSTARPQLRPPSGVLTGLDEGDPEHVFFHDVPPG
jgi:hypothetical protein